LERIVDRLEKTDRQILTPPDQRLKGVVAVRGAKTGTLPQQVDLIAGHLILIKRAFATAAFAEAMENLHLEHKPVARTNKPREEILDMKKIIQSALQFLRPEHVAGHCDGDPLPTMGTLVCNFENGLVTRLQVFTPVVTPTAIMLAQAWEWKKQLYHTPLPDIENFSGQPKSRETGAKKQS